MTPGVNKGLLKRVCKKNIHIYNFINYNDLLPVMAVCEFSNTYKNACCRFINLY